MTKTTYILTGAALALMANAAGAFDFYGNFSNHETVVRPDRQGAATPSRGAYSPGPRTSLDALTAGSPDSAGRPIPGYVEVMDPTAPSVTSLELLTAGNPDSSVRAIRGQALGQPASGMAASRPGMEPSGV